jgi:RHS repeat-associated protein
MTPNVYRYLLPFALLSISSVLTCTALAQQSMCAPVSNNPLVMENLCNDAPRAEAVPAVQKMGASRPAQNLLTLTAAEINSMRLDNPPMIRVGDALVFEANRSDFVLELYLSNGKEIVTQPLTQADAENTLVAWKKGRTKLDYAETLNQYVVAMKIKALHETGTPLLLRGVKIDRKGSYILELEKNNPGPTPKVPEPPMSYPPDPRVMTASVTMPNLLGRGPQAGFLAPHIPSFSMRPFLMQSSGGTGDLNHFKYAGQELDAETGLYHMGARYYSPGMGRFTSPDPLYIEMHRLSDPQRLNLYAYGRNNPTTFSDPTGLDIALGCKGAQANCDTALSQLNGRERAQFKAGLDKNNKLTAHVTNAEYKKLSTAEKALYSAINNQNNHATLNVVNQSGTVTMGVHNGPGTNTVDVADTAKLNSPSNAGGLNAGDAVAHEAMQAYISLSDDAQSDNRASFLFPGTNYVGSALNYNTSKTAAIGSDIKADIADGRGSEIVSTQYRTPIPAVDIFTKGITRATTGVERDVTGVEFVPKKPE